MFKTGEDLREWRKKMHLTQKELSLKINYSVSRIAHIEGSSENLSKKI